MIKRVYVAGPYTKPDPVLNTKAAILLGHQLLDRGYAPLIPHLTHYMEAVRSRPYEDWMQMDFEWVKAADAVLRMPGESSGADREVTLAKSLSIPVFYSLEELKNDWRNHVYYYTEL